MVLLRSKSKPERVLGRVSDPSSIGKGEEVLRLSLDIRATDFDFIERYAAYRNALAKAEGKRLGRLWSRKSMAESMLTAEVHSIRNELAEMIGALGELPDPKDPDELARYVKRVVSWDKKTSK